MTVKTESTTIYQQPQDLNSYSKTEFGIIAGKIIDKQLSVTKKIPDQIRDEIPTLNRMGYMKLDMDEFCQGFIDYAKDNNDELLLELGCAYGMIVQKVLATNAKIIASDLSEEHLTVLLANTSAQYLNNLYLYPAAFPYGIDLPAESLGAVLTSRMVHFLTPEQVEAGFKKIHRWLKPGGKLFFTSVSPYHDAFRERFAPTYEQNLKEGKEWPGVIENQWEINPKHKEYVEPYLNVFDVPQLEKLLPKYGFEIDSIKLFDYPNDTESRNLGHIGFIATKL